MSFLSIIIPTFNSRKTLLRCLESLALQTYRNFEVIVMDGLSNDNTFSIAESFRNTLPSLILISEKDAGVYDAMNKGIALSNGEWIYFLGSDDELCNQNVLSDIFVNNAEIINNNDFVYGNVNSVKYGKRYDGEFDDLKLLFKNICHQSIFYRKSVFSSIGLYNLNYPILGDYEYNIRCFGNNKIRKQWIDIVIANYADEGLSSHTFDVQFTTDLHLIFEKALRKPQLAKLIIELRNIHNTTQAALNWRESEVDSLNSELANNNEVLEKLSIHVNYLESYTKHLEENQINWVNVMKKIKTIIRTKLLKM